jgi:hypothetical protein
MLLQIRKASRVLSMGLYSGLSVLVDELISFIAIHENYSIMIHLLLSSRLYIVSIFQI